MKTQRLVLEPKKQPSQARSQQTFDAIVEACARLLARHGYAALSTNHIADAAGVGIASVYEYFPGKEAVVAQVAAALVQRVMTQLAAHMDAVIAGPPELAARRWTGHVYSTLRAEKALVAVFVYEVPFTNRLPLQRGLMPLLRHFSQTAAVRAGAPVRNAPAELYLLINLVSSTLLQLVLDPPADLAVDAVLDALARRVEDWMQGRGDAG